MKMLEEEHQHDKLIYKIIYIVLTSLADENWPENLQNLLCDAFRSLLSSCKVASAHNTQAELCNFLLKIVKGICGF